MSQDDQNGVGSTFCFAVLCTAAWSLLWRWHPFRHAKLRMHNATILKKCSAVVFADLKAAFCCTVLEYVPGVLSDAASTEKLSRKLALSPQLALQLRASATQGTECLLSPPFWARAAADWHRCAAFHVPGSPDMVVTHAGTKVSDSLARSDLLHCILPVPPGAPASPPGRRPSFSSPQARSFLVGILR